MPTAIPPIQHPLRHLPSLYLTFLQLAGDCSVQELLEDFYVFLGSFGGLLGGFGGLLYSINSLLLCSVTL